MKLLGSIASLAVKVIVSSKTLLLTLLNSLFNVLSISLDDNVLISFLLITIEQSSGSGWYVSHLNFNS